MLAAALLCGCVHGWPQALPIPSLGAPRISEDELRAQVQAASSRFGAAIAGTSDTIESQAASSDVRRRALLWKVRITPLLQRAAALPRATEGLLALMTLSTAQHSYLVDGSGASLFGDLQPLARSTAEEIEVDMAALPEQLLDADEAKALVAEVEKFSARHPIRGEFVIATPQAVRADLQRSRSIQKVLELPLTPFRALEGVESGAGSIRDFNATARQFNDLLASLPQQTRWQLQLFLYDLESRDSLQRGVASLEQMAESSQRFSAAFEHLPEATRRELTTFLAESPQTQRDLRLTIASAADALARVDPLLHTLERVAGAVGGAGDSWAEVVREVKRERPPDVAAAARPEGRPFDIADYERTARAVQGAAAEIRAALAELPSGSDWSPLVDQLFWRAVALMGVAFALLLTYRILTRRFGAEPHVVRRG